MAETPREAGGKAQGSPAASLVAPLDAFGDRDIDQAGGKGANLSELMRAGYRVPRGFIITTGAYRAVVEHSGLSARLRAHLTRLEEDASDDAAARISSVIRADLAQVDVHDEVRAAILSAYASLGGGPVAVRSSATAEDLPGAAFAGQHDTYLNVIGENAVVNAVRACWGSLWNDRAIAYRRQRGSQAEDVRMAVIVQSMVEADTAGVMLTANPVSGARDEIVVDASAGLGEAVVSGLVTPDHYVLDAQGRVREWRPGQGEVVIRGKTGGGVISDTTGHPPARRLPESILVELAHLGTSVAGHFGRPQDIEWATADGQVWLLQSRPLTALPPPPLRLNRIQRLTGPHIIEMLPERPYPLDMSSWIIPGLGRMVTRMLDEIAGLHVDFTNVLPEVDGVVDRFVPPIPRPTPRLLTAVARNMPRIHGFDPGAWMDDPRFTEFERRVRGLGERDPAELTWEELAQVPRQALNALDIITDLRIDYLPRAGMSLLRLRLILKVLGLPKLFPLLISGAPTRTGDANRAVAALANRVRTDPHLSAIFDRLNADSLDRHLRQQHESRDFRNALDAFLAEYGHRETTSPLLITSPTWSESPPTVLGAVKALVQQRAEPFSTAKADAALRRVLEHPWVHRTRSRGRVLSTVNAVRVGIAVREDTHFYGTRIMPIMRRALLEMGRRLAEADVLREQREIVHLRLEELERLPDPRAISQTLGHHIARTVRTRSLRREELSGVPLITTAVLFPDSPADADTILVGTAASGGQATGPVRIIRGPTDFGQMEGGDILVCPYTNPAWTPLFQRAAAVVADTGGAGSHAAIVAREYGIPAVMGTGVGTSLLTDGQIVTVDGDRGCVTKAVPA